MIKAEDVQQHYGEMEVFVENDNINVCDILKLFGLDYKDKEQNIIDSFLESDKTFCISLFPDLIKDIVKYNQVEIYYQKYLDREITKEEFFDSERKFWELLKSFWIYNDTYVFIENDYREITSSFYWRKNRRELIKSKHLIEKISNSQLFWKIDSIYDLSVLSKISTREISREIFFFQQSGLVISIDGCCGILCKTKSDDLLFNKIIAKSSLYFWQP